MYSIFFVLNAIGHLLSLVIFLFLFARYGKAFIIPAAIHLVASQICYSLDFQPWVILFFSVVWFLSGCWMIYNRWHNQLKNWLKIILVLVAIIHNLTWADAFYERLIKSGWYGYYVQHHEVHDDYAIRSRRSMHHPYLTVELVNKQHPIFQKITKLPLHGTYPISNLEWLPLEQDSVLIKMKVDGMKLQEHKIYLHNY